MNNLRKRLSWVVALTIFYGATVWICVPNSLRQALEESLRPTTVKMIPLPEGCTRTDEVPPASLMRIVDYQAHFYHLKLQTVIVCRTNGSPSQESADSAKAFSIPESWLPLYIGCCTYQFGRHVAVVAMEQSEKGTVIVEAALVQGRLVYFRSNWAADRRTKAR
jgi:hypothetical protein